LTNADKDQFNNYIEGTDYNQGFTTRMKLHEKLFISDISHNVCDIWHLLENA
jgi:hypothetical protein